MMATFGNWLQAARPKTLPAAAVPVVLGTAIAASITTIDWSVFIATLLAALLIQIITNYANDAYDFERGSDTADRTGPARVVQAGLISAKSMKRATAALVVVALGLGLFLASIGGWPIVLIGTTSILLALAYTAGPFPLAYNGLGDIFVIIYFGPVAVAGTYYLFTGNVHFFPIVAGIGCGAWSTAILTVNNLRDIETDRLSNKRTLAVRFGKTFARVEYSLLLVLAFCCVLILREQIPNANYAVFSFLVAGPALYAVWRGENKNLLAALPITALGLIIYGLGLSAAFLGW